MSLGGRVFATLAGALALGATVSLAKLWFFCRQPESEACVWGKAYLPLSLPFEAVAVGCVVLMILAGVRMLTRKAADAAAPDPTGSAPEP